VADVWPYWVSTATTVPLMVTSSTATTTWVSWNTTATTGTVGVWGNWSQTYVVTQPIILQAGEVWGAWNTGYQPIQVQPETAGQRAAREEHTRQRNADQAHRRQVRERARDKALALLMSFLDDDQQRTYSEMGYFDIAGSRGRRWRIEDRGQSGNVLLLPSAGEVAESFCCHPPGGLPDADAHLAQMLHLVTDEDDFERTANRSGRRHLTAVA
jgi:hypothetical protein